MTRIYENSLVLLHLITNAYVTHEEEFLDEVYVRRIQ